MTSLRIPIITALPRRTAFVHIIQPSGGVVVHRRAAVAVLALLGAALALAAVFFAGGAGLEGFALHDFEGVFFFCEEGGVGACVRVGVGEGGDEGGEEEGGCEEEEMGTHGGLDVGWRWKCDG